MEIDFLNSIEEPNAPQAGSNGSHLLNGDADSDSQNSIADILEDEDFQVLADLNADELLELRRLLLSPEQQKLNELHERADNLRREFDEIRAARVEIVGEILPQAVAFCDGQDELPEAMMPVTEDAIRLSVERHPNLLADALYPIFAPSVVRLISDAIAQMTQSTNETLTQSLSLQGWRWRLEALQTGKPFAEIVLLHTLRYRVEQVFLIHTETGLLIEQANADETIAADADMVSGMLTAIQDFVGDSFQHQTNKEMLDTLRVGRLQVWIERGDFALLAGVIRGNAPVALREVFAKTIKRIHFTYRRELENFNGDSAPFADVRQSLEGCLQAQYTAESEEKTDSAKSFFSPVNVIGSLLLGGFLIWATLIGVDYWRWTNYLAQLRGEPGIIITTAERGWWRHQIGGLRDPLAKNPDALLSEFNLSENSIERRWQFFHALEDEFILHRAQNILQPPNGINLTFADGVLTVRGAASQLWLTDAKKIAPAISGVAKIDVSAAQIVDDEFQINRR